MFVFFFSASIPGGVQSLIIRAVKVLNKNGEKAKVVTGSNFFIRKELDKIGSDYIFIDADTVKPNHLNHDIDRDDVCVFTDFSSPYIPVLRKINPKVFFYVVMGKTFIGRGIEKVATKDEMIRFITFLNQKQGLYFIDYDNYICPCNYYKFNLEPINYIPVPVDTFPQNLYSHTEKCRCITYIGRGGEIWKIYPVKKILEDLSVAHFKGEFHIITDSTEYFEKILSQSSIDPNITLKYCLGLTGETLDEYLLNFSDLHVAMGTSALEGAKLGIPTLLIDSSYLEFPVDYTYRWLYYKNLFFSLGRWLEKEGILEGMPLTTILSEMNDGDKRRLISQKCFEYVNQRHSMMFYYNNLKNAENVCELRIDDLFQTPFFRNYSRYMNVYRYMKGKMPRLTSWLKSMVYSVSGSGK